MTLAVTLSNASD